MATAFSEDIGPYISVRGVGMWRRGFARGVESSALGELFETQRLLTVTRPRLAATAFNQDTGPVTCC